MIESVDSKITLYVIIKATGEVKKLKRGTLAVYNDPGIAKNHARDPGDSVVEAKINLWNKPLFIR